MSDTVDQEIRTLQSIFWSERDPDGLAFASLADAFRRKGEVREALDLLTDGMSRHPDYATGHVVATRLYVDQAMHSEAELAARRVLELDPENLVALSALVSILDGRGESGEAARHKTTLFAADPDSEEARAVADIDLDAAGVEGVTAEPVTVETPLELVGDTEDEPPEITELVPETMYHEGDIALPDGPTTEAEGVGPEGDGDAEEDELASDMAGELAADPLDLTNLSIGDEQEDEVLDIGALAPDEPDDDVLDLAALAPGESVDDDVVELAALAPDEIVDDVVELATLAPDEGAEEVLDIGALAPDEPDDVVDMAALAPDEEPDEDVVEMASLAPDVSVEELAEDMELAEPAEEEEADDEESTEPIYTRTLADLYIKQGFHDKALEVLKHIQKRQPDAPDLVERIEALEKGEAPESGFGSKGGSVEDVPPPPTTAPASVDAAARAEDDLERRARELAEPDDDHAMDTPFAWDEGDEQPRDAEEEEDDGIGTYLEGLLEWEGRSEP